MKVFAEIDDAWIDLARERVVEQVDIADFIETKGLGELNREGKMCCPIHDESGPSCFVDTSKQVFKCFGCGAGGTVVEMWMGHQRAHTADVYYSQKRAIMDIAREYGIPLPKRDTLVEVGTKIGKVDRASLKKKDLTEEEKELVLRKANKQIAKFSKGKQKVIMLSVDMLLEGRYTVEKLYALLEKKGVVKGNKCLFR